MSVQLLHGDCRDVLRTLADGSVHCCVTSPPYFGLRDYGVDGQIGLEPTPAEYVAQMVEVFREVRRVLRDDGTLWVNYGDAYAGSWGAQSRGDFTPGTLEGASCKETSLSARQIKAHPKTTGTGSLKATPGCKAKDLIGLPWMLAFALRADGWYLRQDIVWHKPNPMPESVRDRCTKAHEYVFLLSKSERYFWDAEAMKEPAVGANLHDVTGRTKQRGLADTFKRKDSKRAQAIPGQSVGTHREDRPDSTYDLYTRNRRSVWTVATRPYKGAHFATFPPALIEPCILAGAPFDGVVLDPFTGSGTTAAVALQHGRRFIGCELNPDYIKLAEARIAAAEAEVLW